MNKKEPKKGESWRKGYQVGRQEAVKELYDKIIDEWADVAEIRLETIKRIVESFK